jgi:hypothetical protein
MPRLARQISLHLPDETAGGGASRRRPPAGNQLKNSVKFNLTAQIFVPDGLPVEPVFRTHSPSARTRMIWKLWR